MARPKTGVTPLRNVRVPDEVWHAAKARAERRHETLSAVIVAALEKYAQADDDPDRPATG